MFKLKETVDAMSNLVKGCENEASQAVEKKESRGSVNNVEWKDADHYGCLHSARYSQNVNS